jgi:predicted regulator of Ras-like GTPase activity (Roadblock/LC7/MglB family)
MTMMGSDLIMYEEEFSRINAELQKLHQQSNAKVVFLVDKNGQLIASAGETRDIDTTSLASLTAGNIVFHEGEKDNIHISMIGQRIILVVIFDGRTSIGLVRLRVKKASDALAKIFDEIVGKYEKEKGTGKLEESFFAEISDEDIDNLFK